MGRFLFERFNAIRTYALMEIKIGLFVFYCALCRFKIIVRAIINASDRCDIEFVI